MTSEVNDGLTRAQQSTDGPRVSISTLELSKAGTARDITAYLTLMHGLVGYLAEKKLSG